MHTPTGPPHERTLDVTDLLGDPIGQFLAWLQEAGEHGVVMPNAMALATADQEGRPAVRHVLLRQADERGFVFFTNYESRKARHLEATPHAALVFLWKTMDRQVCVTGRVERATQEESDAYFATRPRAAQIGAWASPQSAVIPSRAELDERLVSFERRFEGEDVPRPTHWGGYRVLPETIEFWQGREFRLHDRFRYTRGPDGWRLERLAP